MGIMAYYSLFSVMQDLDHQPYLEGELLWKDTLRA